MTVGDVMLLIVPQWYVMTVHSCCDVGVGRQSSLFVGDGDDLFAVVAAAFFADAVGEACFAADGAEGHLHAFISVCRFADTNNAFADFALLNSHGPYTPN